MSADEERARSLPTWMSALDEDTLSWSDLLGGWRGVAESVLPTVVFLVCYLTTSRLLLTVGAAVAAALLLGVWRLVAGGSFTRVLGGLGALGIGVVWALWSGRASDYFAWGVIVAGLLTVVVLVSILLRRPLVGVALRLVRGWDDSFWSGPASAPLRRRCAELTWLWAAMFALRLGVQLPLWLTDATSALAVAKLVLGLPLFALVCWLTWVGLSPLLGDARPGARPDAGAGHE